MFSTPSRLVIAALRGGSGKTILSLGLIRAWLDAGLQVAPFKKGPDFIDASWLAFAARRPCHNLDPFLMNEGQILHSYLSRSRGAELSLVEGNRGLYDGLDVEGCCSTAELAKLLKAPVLLVVDVTMATRTVAALVMGCQAFDPNLNIAGVILNRVAGRRQETLIRNAIETYCATPVLGSVPKLKGNPFPERHMGLVPHQERGQAEKAVAWAEKTVKDNLELHEILRVAQEVGPLGTGPTDLGERETQEVMRSLSGPPRIGFIRDKSFWFYYPENLEQLEQLGALLIEIDAMSERRLPQLDALYVGGGFPETQAQALSDNAGFRASLKQEIENGLPVYAECGGLMYMGESLILGEREYPMVGALPVKFVLERKPQGHGYTLLEVARPNPYHPQGSLLKGHEFHYSRAVVTQGEGVAFAFKMRRGHGLDGQRDGLIRKNLLATYTHLHAAGNPAWAKRFFMAAVAHLEHGDKNFTQAKKSD
jgi:cobyrinic acid a,c-diamide synthase